jgi:Cu+-exporting ATPase
VELGKRNDLVESALNGGMTMDQHDGQATQAIDPVCGMEVDPATAAGSSEYEGTTYYFCSVGCKRQFDKDPQVFVDQTPH